MLILPIKKKWFNMILSGEKKEEYREIKPYWTMRFLNEFGLNFQGKVRHIVFRNGYSKNSPVMLCDCKLREGQGKKEWGAEPNKEYYILEILEILEVSNVKNKSKKL